MEMAIGEFPTLPPNLLHGCLIGLGLVERDGILVLAGFLLGAIGVGLSIGFVLALVTGAEKIF